MSYEKQREQEAIRQNRKLKEMQSKVYDNVNHPAHYTKHPSGVECIQITQHMDFNLGNAMKYIWRCDLKKDAIEDLKKAQWYISQEIKKRESEIKRVSDDEELQKSLQPSDKARLEEVVDEVWKEYRKDLDRRATLALSRSGLPWGKL